MDIISDDALSTMHRSGGGGLLSVASALTAAALTAYAFYRKYYHQGVPEGLENIPSPQNAYPYVGHLLSLSEQPMLQFMQWHRELGSIFRLQMGVKTWIVISDPTIAHELLVGNGNITSGRPFSVLKTKHRSMNGRGLICSSPNKAWRQMRTVTNALLGSKKMASKFTQSLNDQVDRLVIALMSGSGAQKNMDPTKVLERASLQFILTTCFGKDDTNDDTLDEVIRVMDHGHEIASSDVTTYLPVLSLVLGKTEEMYRHYIETEREPLFRRLVDQSGEEGVVRSLKDMKEMGQMDDQDILAAAGDLLEGGTESLATALLWAFVILSTQKDAQYQIVEEIASFASEHQRLPTFADRDALPFLVSVQKECMRFRPITPFGEFHETEQDVEWRGHVLPKGTTIVTSLYPMHADPEVYEQPEEFIPDRFVDNTSTMASLANAKVGQRDHFNFGWGRRVCPGAQLAEEQMFTVFVRLFTNCTIEPALDEEGQPIEIDLDNITSNGRVTTPAGNIMLRFVRHEDSMEDEEEDDDDDDGL